MSTIPTRAEACQKLGCADSELVDILEAPAGVVFVMSDGNSYIDVPADQPDADGKTGLMFLAKPHVDNEYGYRGDFPVFTNHPEEPAQDADASADDVAVGSGLDGMKKPALLELAKDLGVDVRSTATKGEIIAAIKAFDAENGGSDQ